MGSNGKDASLQGSGPALPSSDEPEDASDAREQKADARIEDVDPLVEEHEVPDAPDAGGNGDASGVRPVLSEEVILRFLNRKATVRFMQSLVAERLESKGLHDDVEDVAQQASVRILTSKWKPSSEEGLPSWVARLTKIEVYEYFRAGAKHRKHLDLDGDPETVRGEDESDVHERVEGKKFHIFPWMQKQVAGNPSETEGLAWFREHAHGKTYAQIASAAGVTENTVTKRIQALKNKYIPRWEKHRWELENQQVRRERMFLLLKVAAFIVAFGVAALIVWWLMQPRVQDIRREPEPTPSASASAAPAPSLDIAAPTDAGPTSPKPPAPLKPPLKP